MDPPDGNRIHIVLVPGFGGFDGLGQLEYYAGVTPLFRRWQRRPKAGRDDDANRRPAVLHYFDNLPTAGVATRAERLEAYLAKRFARGEFLPGDSVALVGHSTGGLDIRRAVLDLHARRGEPIAVDGAHGASFTVDPSDLLKMLRRLVFLSVPQWGTNIADWVQGYRMQREVFVANLCASVRSAQIGLIDKAEALLADLAASLTDADLLLAVRDALAEIDEKALPPAERRPVAVAEAQEASAELSLWVKHIASDFSAIDDLACRPYAGSTSPAHFDGDQRQDELRLWKDLGIGTRSYATVGARPFVFTAGSPAPRWELSSLATYPNRTPQTGEARNMDFLYRLCYRACAGGPFEMPAGTAPVATTLRNQKQEIEVWDNDGIVNTASMLWPDGPDTILVAGDHGDIIGHHRLVRATPPSPRRYHTYDLLRSVPPAEADGFAQTFQEVWSDVFEFAVG